MMARASMSALAGRPVDAGCQKAVRLVAAREAVREKANRVEIGATTKKPLKVSLGYLLIWFLDILRMLMNGFA